ncbi:ribosome maturation factor RimP [Thermosyntropha lipolytica DSM 11003]|uniref:Ribosome maturation factor RimP n=1 Tax=Thermosyntropha lipolytica DSM 11003 TaxID=1123382 RepID=A0A1M5KXN1_9FIRM|nr:ribosome maturation factor RimP [Thermosyntropha lipolytica]SHG56923.1 ribosome maturation factor RimP [Thermosyntropha lipolytica DSM 11003]
MPKVAVQEIEALIAPILSSINIELVDIQYRKENKEQILRIFIDTPQGVDIDTCTRATRAIKDIIDEEDIFYDHLEVSSPGLDRIIKKDKSPERFIGRKVKIKMKKDYPSFKNITGILYGVDEEKIELLVDEEVVEIPWEMTLTVRLYPDI